MSKFKVLSLFAGIGGFDLGLERTGGFKTVAFCEIDKFCQSVLSKHWPGVPIYDDVRELTKEQLANDGVVPNVICGGFPCQDISQAGARRGIKDDTRSGLWSEIVRLVGDIRPEFVIVENVANLLAGPPERPGEWFGRVLGDLAELGYDAEWENIPAAALGHAHSRERIWIIAYPHGSRLEAPWPELVAAGYHERPSAEWRNAPPASLRAPNGLPHRMDRTRALGNAVVPQIPELIGRAILHAHDHSNA